MTIAHRHHRRRGTRMMPEILGTTLSPKVTLHNSKQYHHHYIFFSPTSFFFFLPLPHCILFVLLHHFSCSILLLLSPCNTVTWPSTPCSVIHGRLWRVSTATSIARASANCMYLSLSCHSFSFAHLMLAASSSSSGSHHFEKKKGTCEPTLCKICYEEYTDWATLCCLSNCEHMYLNQMFFPPFSLFFFFFFFFFYFFFLPSLWFILSFSWSFRPSSLLFASLSAT